MDLFQVMARFPDQQACINHLERIRWGDNPCCPHCGSVDVYRKKDGTRIGRWHCKDCHASYNVLAKTLFQGTQIRLQKWFAAIAIGMNAKKSISSHQLARDLNLNQKTAWFMIHRIRSEMASKTSMTLLEGIIEADETYMGGKPRKGNRKKDDPPNKRGRGTKKTAVLGAVQRGGDVKAQMITNVTGRGIMQFLKRHIRIGGSRLVTDQFRAYRAVYGFMEHDIINHKIQYVDGDVHTNTIEGFWALLKRAWYGQHHHYKTGYMPLYIAEACYKYNNRNTKNVFDKFLVGCVNRF